MPCKILELKTARQIANCGKRGDTPYALPPKTKKKMKNKKNGQLKIQQMSFMLIAITLFFALVGMFFLTLQVSKIKESAKTLEEKNALLLVTKLANSPEFSCGAAFGSERANCVDSDKVMALKNDIKKYGNFWGVTNIQIRKLYPISNNTKECNLNNYPDCNLIKIQDKEITSEYSNFISLCRKESSNGEIYDKCEVAQLTVSYGK